MKKMKPDFPKLINWSVSIAICTVLLMFPVDSPAQMHPTIGLAPDDGFPVWLTPDPIDYLPLRTNQTSGMDWIATDTDPNGLPRHYLLIADDSDEGSINVISVQSVCDDPSIVFHPTNLTLPPPEVSMIPIEPGHGYDWEAVATHPWSESIFLSQEGLPGEIGIYHAMLTPGDVRAGDNAAGPAGEVIMLPGHIANIRKLDLPGWNEAFADHLYENRGIEGIACSKNRLFLGLESPYEFPDRMISELSTVLAVWKIDSGDPSDMESSELLSIHDTANWEETLGFRIETICGLDAIDDNHIFGIDRDNACLFVVELDNAGDFVDGRIFRLATPGPEPLPSDECPDIDHPPRLVRPSLESVALVPDGDDSYFIYLAVDPWPPGWALMEEDWECPGYEARLISLLPALYRYSVPVDLLFPRSDQSDDNLSALTSSPEKTAIR